MTAVVLDAVVTSWMVVATAMQRLVPNEEKEWTPVALHLGHLTLFLIGSLVRVVPSTSGPLRLLAWSALVTAAADGAGVWYHLHEQTGTLCGFFAALGGLLLLSALNVAAYAFREAQKHWVRHRKLESEKTV